MPLTSKELFIIWNFLTTFVENEPMYEELRNDYEYIITRIKEEMKIHAKLY